MKNKKTVLTKTKNKLDKFKYIKNISKEDAEATILIYDSIGVIQDENGNLVAGVDGSTFASTMQYLEEFGIKKVNIRINSPGGSVVEGYSIISAIKNSNMEVHTYNDGLCASIAALIFASGDYRHAMDYSITMIHNPSGTDESEILNRIKESLITILKNNSIYSEEELDKLMDLETYFNAEEALEAGICDDIINSGEKVEFIYEDIYEMTNLFNKIINKIDMKKKTIKNKLEEEKPGVESPETLANELEKEVVAIKNEDEEIMDKSDLEDEDDPEMEEGDEAQDGDDCMDYEKMYNDLMEKHSNMSTEMESMKSEKEEMASKLEKMKDEVRKENKKRIDAMVNDLFVAGKIGKTEIDSVRALAEKDFDSVKNLFNRVGLVKNVSFKDVVNTDTASFNGLEKGWTIRDYEKKNPTKLAEIKNNLPSVYNQLYKETYGVEPK